MLCGVAHLIFMPFLLLFLTLYFGLQNAYDWKSTEQYLGPKDWSTASKWCFREFNELPHSFERRLAQSHQAADNYLKLFGQSEAIASLGRILVFVGGSLGAVLLAFAAVNDAILLHVKIADWNLLWYAGVAGALYSVGKALIPDADAQPRTSRNVVDEADEALLDITKHTHYYPSSWKRRAWEESTHATIADMYQVKAKLFLQEMLSLIAAPYLLCVSLPACAETICEFIVAIKADTAGVGDICGYSTFDFTTFCDEEPGNHSEPLTGTLTESILQIGNVAEAMKSYPKPKAKYGKMRSSLVDFKVSNFELIAECPQNLPEITSLVGPKLWASRH